MSILETTLRWVVAAAAAGVLASLLIGVTRSQGRPVGRSTEHAEAALNPWVQVAIGVGFFAAAGLLWRPLGWEPQVPIVPTLVGALLALVGLALVGWGRVTLGVLYDVSSAAGARLQTDHLLITHGPYALVRHPMYVGIEIACVGGLLLYRTWTMVFLVVAFSGLAVRARREDELLYAEFGNEWLAYRDHVPGWFPRILEGRK